MTMHRGLGMKVGVLVTCAVCALVVVMLAGCTSTPVPVNHNGNENQGWNQNTSDEDASTTLADGWYLAAMNREPNAAMPVFYIDATEDEWTITSTGFERSQTEAGLWDSPQDVRSGTWTVPLAQDAELYMMGGTLDSPQRSDISRDRWPAIFSQEVIQWMLVFHVDGGQVVSAHFTSVPGM